VNHFDPKVTYADNARVSVGVRFTSDGPVAQVDNWAVPLEVSGDSLRGELRLDDGTGSASSPPTPLGALASLSAPS
jgi:hypothetical protein